MNMFLVFVADLSICELPMQTDDISNVINPFSNPLLTARCDVMLISAQLESLFQSIAWSEELPVV